MNAQTEVGLLQAMASAKSLEEQRRLAAELEALRARKREQRNALPGLTPEALGSQHAASVRTETVRDRSTFDTDWLAEVKIASEDPAQIENEMRAEAVVWAERGLDPVVRDYPEEVRAQAHSMADHLAARYGEHAELAKQAFLAQAKHTLQAAFGDDEAQEYGPPPQPGHEEYGQSGSSLPKAVEDPETHDHGMGDAPQQDTQTDASDTPSLAEGTEPESGQEQSLSESPSGTHDESSWPGEGNWGSTVQSSLEWWDAPQVVLGSGEKTVALIYERGNDDVYDRTYNYETAQSYVLQGYVAIAVDGDGHRSRDEIQAMLDADMAAYEDLWGVSKWRPSDLFGSTVSSRRNSRKKTAASENTVAGMRASMGFDFENEMEPDEVPADFEVQPLTTDAEVAAAVDPAICGYCGLIWDDGKSTGFTPTPGGRCPFEYFHEYRDEDEGYTASKKTAEWNPLVSSGEYQRIYVSELEPGMVTAFDKTIAEVNHLPSEKVRVRYTDGTSERYGNPLTTLLIRSDTIVDHYASVKVAEQACVYADTGNCSDDIIEVHTGRGEPVYICGYHEQSRGLPKGASRKQASSWIYPVREIVRTRQDGEVDGLPVSVELAEGIVNAVDNMDGETASTFLARPFSEVHEMAVRAFAGAVFSSRRVAADAYAPGGKFVPGERVWSTYRNEWVIIESISGGKATVRSESSGEVYETSALTAGPENNAFTGKRRRTALPEARAGWGTQVSRRKHASDVAEIHEVEVCQTCLMTAANGYSPHEWGYTPDLEPWGLWKGTPGHAAPGDGEGHFSSNPCEGCGDPLGGDRYQAFWMETKTASRKQAESYNGFPSQDAFHQHLRDRWKEMLSTPEGREQHERAYGNPNSHAGCDHANGICMVTGPGHYDAYASRKQAADKWTEITDSSDPGVVRRVWEMTLPNGGRVQVSQNMSGGPVMFDYINPDGYFTGPSGQANSVEEAKAAAEWAVSQHEGSRKQAGLNADLWGGGNSFGSSVTRTAERRRPSSFSVGDRVVVLHKDSDGEEIDARAVVSGVGPRHVVVEVQYPDGPHWYTITDDMTDWYLTPDPLATTASRKQAATTKSKSAPHRRAALALAPLLREIEVSPEDWPVKEALARMSSLEEKVGGVSGYQMVAHLLEVGQMPRGVRVGLERLASAPFAQAPDGRKPR